MTPTQKLKWAILVACEDYNDLAQGVTEENIDDIYEENEDLIYDTYYEFREGKVETGIPCEYSRHYNCYSVAAKMPDESWVGWTYWYGGGKHGEPEAIDWMSEAYNLTCKEEEKLVVVQTFTKENI